MNKIFWTGTAFGAVAVGLLALGASEAGLAAIGIMGTLYIGSAIAWMLDDF